MPLTVADARNHIRDTLGDAPAVETPELMLINEAGRMLCGMHSWRFLDRRSAPLNFGNNQNYAILPDDVARVQGVIASGTLGWAVEMTSFEEIAATRTVGLGGTSGTWPYMGAITRRLLPPPNLLAYSDAFSQSSAWAYNTGTGTILSDQEVDPFTGETTADNVSDDSVVACSALTQTVPTHLLADGPYTFTAVLRPSPVTTVSPPKTGLLIASEDPLSGGLQTNLEIQWGVTPWSDAPTLTIIDSNTGDAEVLDAVGVGEGYWQITLSGYQYLRSANYGRILVSVQPARALHAAASGTLDVTTIGSVDIVRMQLNEGYAPGTYVSQGAEPGVPRRFVPVLELDRTPTSTTANQLTLVYRGSWVDVENDEDELPLPGADFGDEYCNMLYIQILRAIARGWDEEGNAPADVRLEAIRRGPVFKAATETDGLIRAQIGRMGRGSATQMARYSTGIGTYTDFDSYAGPS